MGQQQMTVELPLLHEQHKKLLSWFRRRAIHF